MLETDLPHIQENLIFLLKCVTMLEEATIEEVGNILGHLNKNSWSEIDKVNRNFTRVSIRRV
jgi:hypothetical protein